jgi:hypothetical protein
LGKIDVLWEIIGFCHIEKDKITLPFLKVCYLALQCVCVCVCDIKEHLNLLKLYSKAGIHHYGNIRYSIAAKEVSLQSTYK